MDKIEQINNKGITLIALVKEEKKIKPHRKFPQFTTIIITAG